MEFTLNVNLNLSEATERTINRLADAFGNSQSAPTEKDVFNAVKHQVEEKGFKVVDEKFPTNAEDEKPLSGDAVLEEAIEQVKDAVQETPKATRTRKPVTPKVEETPVEEAKPEVVEKGTGDFVPDAVAIRSLAIPLAKAGHGVKEKLTELGYGGIGQLSEGGNEEHIKAFYAWLLEETKSLK